MRRVLCAIALLTLMAPSLSAQDISGDWQGAINTRKDHLRVILHVDKAADGGLTAALYSIDENPDAIPVDSITQRGGDVVFSIAGLKLSYKGSVSSDNKTIVGKMTQDGTASFTFVRPTKETAWPVVTAQVKYSNSQPVTLSYGTPGTHAVVPENTLIPVITDQPLSTKKSKVGTSVSFTVSEDVIVDHVLVIPRGAKVHGEVVQDKKAGVVSGSPELTLEIHSLDMSGESYPLYAYQFKVRGASKTKPTRNVEEGLYYAYYGALAGEVVAARTNALPTRKIEVEDMAAGAAVGAGAVAAASVVGPRPVVSIPAESQMDFYLASPISVQPVSEKEAKRLAERLHPGAPVLYVRGDTP